MENLEKPKMGLDVSLTSEKMEPDAWAAKMLREIGETVTKREVGQSMKYVGSMAVHLMIDDNDNIITKPTHRISSVEQICLGDISEQVASIGINNLTVQAIKYFKGDIKTGRRGDKR